jgi:hypothetical protein
MEFANFAAIGTLTTGGIVLGFILLVYVGLIIAAIVDK